TFQQIKDRLGANPVATHIPIGASAPPDPDAFRGVIDLVEMRALFFDPESKGSKIETVDIPEEFRERARDWRGRMLEQVALLDDTILTRYLEEQPIDPGDIRRLLRVGTLTRVLQPVLCGSALNYAGVQPLLDAVGDYLPSPLDRPPVQ